MQHLRLLRDIGDTTGHLFDLVAGAVICLAIVASL